MKTLKLEEVDGRAYRDLADATGSIGRFIEEVYNRSNQNLGRPNSPIVKRHIHGELTTILGTA